MSWKEGFNAALLRFLKEDMGKGDAVEVTSVEESAYEGAQYSEVTKDSPFITVEFYWKDNTGKSRWTEWEGSFADLIGRLTEG